MGITRDNTLSVVLVNMVDHIALHRLGTWCLLILSTPLYWAAFPYWVLSIWSVGVRDWAHDVSTRPGWDHSVDWSIPDIPQSGQECDLTEFPWAGSGHRSSPGGSLWCIWSVWSPGRRYESNHLINMWCVIFQSVDNGIRQMDECS